MRTAARVDADIRRTVDRLGELRLEKRALVMADRRSRLPLRPKQRRWHGEALGRLRADYESGRLLRLIARDHKTSPGCVTNLAAQHNWTRALLPIERRAFPAVQMQAAP